MNWVVNFQVRGVINFCIPAGGWTVLIIPKGKAPNFYLNP